MPERGRREHWEQARRCTSHASPQDTAAASVGKLCLETWVEIAQVTTQKPLKACLPAFTLSQLCFLIDDVLTTGWPHPSLRKLCMTSGWISIHALGEMGGLTAISLPQEVQNSCPLVTPRLDFLSSLLFPGTSKTPFPGDHSILQALLLWQWP